MNKILIRIFALLFLISYTNGIFNCPTPLEREEYRQEMKQKQK